MIFYSVSYLLGSAQLADLSLASVRPSVTDFVTEFSANDSAQGKNLPKDVF